MQEAMPVAIGWKVIVKPCEGKTMTPAGIDLSATQKAQEHLNYIGEIVAMGEAAFTARTQGGIHMDEWQTKPQVGDYVLYPPYGGMAIYRAGKKEAPLRLMNDTDIMALIDDPDRYYTWVDAG